MKLNLPSTLTSNTTDNGPLFLVASHTVSFSNVLATAIGEPPRALFTVLSLQRDAVMDNPNRGFSTGLCTASKVFLTASFGVWGSSV